jgi:sugar phosphate permease
MSETIKPAAPVNTKTGHTTPTQSWQPGSVVSVAYRKIAVRLIPLLFLCYLAAYLDRVNISFVKQQMQLDVGLSTAAYAVGAGIFFIGYFIFEVPSNLLMARIGARKTLLRIMVLWGITSGLMMFAHEQWIFYLLRFLLGVFEAGFTPGIIYFLNKWTPGRVRARYLSLFITATAVAGLVGAPFTGWTLTALNGVAGLEGWQWTFLIQGIPPIVLGIVVFFVLPDTPREARWLTPEQLTAVETALIEDPDAGSGLHVRFTRALRDWRIYSLSIAYFCIAGGIFLVTFWLPTALGEFKIETQALGWLTAIPYLGAVVAMVIMGRLSDHFKERRWFIVIPLLVGAAALLATIYNTSSLAATLVCFTIGAAAIWSAFAVFWSVPPLFYGGVAAAGAIAVINSIGNLNGFVNPYIVGAIQTATGSLTGGLLLTVGGLVLGAIILIFTVRVPKRPDLAVKGAVPAAN